MQVPPILIIAAAVLTGVAAVVVLPDAPPAPVAIQCDAPSTANAVAPVTPASATGTLPPGITLSAPHPAFLPGFRGCRIVSGSLAPYHVSPDGTISGPHPKWLLPLRHARLAVRHALRLSNPVLSYPITIRLSDTAWQMALVVAGDPAVTDSLSHH